MDYIIGFLLGFFLKEISNFIKRITSSSIQKDWDKEWDWITPIQEDDLP